MSGTPYNVIAKLQWFGYDDGKTERLNSNSNTRERWFTKNNLKHRANSITLSTPKVKLPIGNPFNGRT